MNHTPAWRRLLEHPIVQSNLPKFVDATAEAPHLCNNGFLELRSMIRESRRTTRVPLRVLISVEEANHNLTCEGETIVVNLHGALLSTAVGLELGMRISLQVYLTGKSAGARVVYVDSRDRLHCGIELDQPRNIWGISLPPDDWDEIASDVLSQ